MKKLISFFLVCVIALSGCNGYDKQDTKGADKVQIARASPLPRAETDTLPDLTGLALNPLTGEYIDEGVVNRRPVAIVINNLSKALPQSGIGQADIMYEVLAEGGITRLVAVFKDFDAPKIGPIRSARHYFLDFALDHNAVFVHHGGSPQAYSSLNSLQVDNLDGMSLDGKTFFRDQARINSAGLEHSSYTSAELLLAEIETKRYEQELNDDYVAPFDFLEEGEKIEGSDAVKITVPFASQSQVGVFEYDEETGLYARFQNGNEHIDELTGEQLKVSNVIVQYVSMYIISGDDAGRREVGLVSSGEGILFTQGKSIPLVWEKTGHQSPTVWSLENGRRLELTTGKTWICALQQSVEVGIEAQYEPEATATETME